MKIIHSSDLLVGYDFSHAASRAEDLRGRRLGAARTIIALAVRQKAQAILLSGNTLADNRISEDELIQLSEILSPSAVPVYILPGITDPYTPDSPYRTRPELFGGAIQILSRPGPLSLGSDVTLWAYPVLLRGGQDQWDGGKGIAVACVPEASPLADKGFAYLALGGRTHREEEHWPGSPEPTGYGDLQGRVNVLSVEPSGQIRMTTQKTGQLHWSERTESAKDVRAKLEGVANPDSTLLKLTVRGALSEADHLELEQALREARLRFFHLDITNNSTIRESAEDRYQNFLLQVLARNLKAQEAVDTAVTQRALLRLRALVQAVGPAELE
jgi:DNA repair exonuclease SbcCD nuclease subunit